MLRDLVKRSRKEKNTHRHDKAKIEAMTRNKPLHTNSWAIKKLQDYKCQFQEDQPGLFNC